MKHLEAISYLEYPSSPPTLCPSQLRSSPCCTEPLSPSTRAVSTSSEESQDSGVDSDTTLSPSSVPELLPPPDDCSLEHEYTVHGQGLEHHPHTDSGLNDVTSERDDEDSKDDKHLTHPITYPPSSGAPEPFQVDQYRHSEELSSCFSSPESSPVRVRVTQQPERSCRKRRRYVEDEADEHNMSEYNPSDEEWEEYADPGNKRKRRKTEDTGDSFGTRDGKTKKRLPSICPAYHLGCTSVVKRVSDSVRHFRSACRFNVSPSPVSSPIVKVEEKSGREEVIVDGKAFFVPVLSQEEYDKYVLKRKGYSCVCGKVYKRADAVHRHQIKCREARSVRHHVKRKSSSRKSRCVSSL